MTLTKTSINHLYSKKKKPVQGAEDVKQILSQFVFQEHLEKGLDTNAKTNFGTAQQFIIKKNTRLKMDVVR